MRKVAVVVCALMAFAGLVLQGASASAGSQGGRAADLVAIEKARQQDIAATFSRDPVALTDLWTDDARSSALVGRQPKGVEAGVE